MNVEVEQFGVELEVFFKLIKKLILFVGYNYVFDVKVICEDGIDVNGNIFFGSNGVNVVYYQFILCFDYCWIDVFFVWGVGIYGELFEWINEGGVIEICCEFYDCFDLGVVLWVLDNVVVRIWVENIIDEKDFSLILEGVVIDIEGKFGCVFWVGVDFFF